MRRGDHQFQAGHFGRDAYHPVLENGVQGDQGLGSTVIDLVGHLIRGEQRRQSGDRASGAVGPRLWLQNTGGRLGRLMATTSSLPRPWAVRALAKQSPQGHDLVKGEADSQEMHGRLVGKVTPHSGQAMDQ